MLPKFRKLVDDRRGATAIEYGLIVALVVIVVMGGIQAVGGGNGRLWGSFTAQVATAES